MFLYKQFRSKWWNSSFLSVGTPNHKINNAIQWKVFAFQGTGTLPAPRTNTSFSTRDIPISMRERERRGQRVWSIMKKKPNQPKKMKTSRADLKKTDKHGQIKAIRRDAAGSEIFRAPTIFLSKIELPCS